MKIVYVVICYMIGGEDGVYHIDSVWTSARKADKRVDELNSDAKKEWREDYGYGFFQSEPITRSK